MNKPAAVALGLAALLGVFALIMVLRLPPPVTPVPHPSDQTTEPAASKSVGAGAISPSAAQESASTIKEPSPASSSERIGDSPSAAPGISNRKTGANRTKAPIQDPEARAALSLVGLDLDAEQYWVAAINDPTLSPEERKDLIEDLNEDGLSDPKNPTEADLELIANRLELIEDLAPNAIDEVNFEAFQEAYKDLLGMLAGKRVK